MKGSGQVGSLERRSKRPSIHNISIFVYAVNLYSTLPSAPVISLFYQFLPQIVLRSNKQKDSKLPIHHFCRFSLFLCRFLIDYIFYRNAISRVVFLFNTDRSACRPKQRGRSQHHFSLFIIWYFANSKADKILDPLLLDFVNFFIFYKEKNVIFIANNRHSQPNKTQAY